jgi:hypothetical protein
VFILIVNWLTDHTLGLGQEGAGNAEH